MEVKEKKPETVCLGSMRVMSEQKAKRKPAQASKKIDSQTSTSKAYYLGIDVGSTTVKLVVLDEDNTVLYQNYERHHTDVKATARTLFAAAQSAIGDIPLHVAITGSGGLLLSQWLNLNFVQEVIASKRAVETLIPKTDVAIELGGEDAKIIYLDGGVEQRMNGTCAGGTGAFIDQMAALLHTDAAGLNTLAKSATHIYPIASRCGVFAKTDVQPLLNEGAPQEDIAASIFQAVANQTVSGLACGHPIRGYVAFLGGPLQYLDQLRERFYTTLNLDVEHRIVPENAHLFVATGAALAAKDSVYDIPSSEKKERDGVSSHAAQTLTALIERLDALGETQGEEVERLNPLFKDEEDYKAFCARHDKEVVPKGDIATYAGPVFIGIDAGSTTMKAAMVGANGELLYTWYGNNNGDVLGTAKKIMKLFYEVLPQESFIAHVTTTGYGEALLQEALKADSGEIETVAHLRGAQAFVPDVQFILDIGGQDMKCLRVRDGVIHSIMLNEACSSGCGSFIESFANAMNMDVKGFAEAALFAKHPVDLGSRCTVFMNSRVKQAQKEGATVGDIAAGLSYSVIKNALFKVIKLRDKEEVGTHIVVQGGTFMSDATLRAFETLLGKDAIRPDIAGVMGAYGAALLARERAEKIAVTQGTEQAGDNEGARDVRQNAPCVEKMPHSRILSAQEIEDLSPKISKVSCKGCSNACLLTINDFGEGRRFITGNRCEKGAGLAKKKKNIPNLFKEKEELLFNRVSLPERLAPRKTIGIPRALNMYENYPFWHTLFTRLGFSVVLSDPSTKKIYEAGIESMPSESVCYPAKLSHGHVMNLLEKGVEAIWMPCVRWEREEDETAGNHFNCPIVMSYPQSLELNVEELSRSHTSYLAPFLPYDNPKELLRRLDEVLNEYLASKQLPRLSVAEIKQALKDAWAEDETFKKTMQQKGDATLAWMEQNHTRGIVLAGRPYHTDPEINHALPDLIASFGFAVLTEDSVAHHMRPERPIRVVDQWMYHSRLYRAARFVATRDDLDLIQMNSFGCGLDALTTDQVQEILEANDKIYTVLKIDEVSNLGAARIRIRSLIAALNNQEQDGQKPLIDIGASSSTPTHASSHSSAFPKVRYTKEMQEAGYTILCPQMAPIHFSLVAPLIRAYGYNLVLLPSVDKGAVDAGLKYVNNDICYPSILVTGQIMEAIESGDYDLSKTAVLISQTGGGCRATNYIALIRKALKDAGHPEIPVVSISVAGGLDEDNPGFDLVRPKNFAKHPMLLPRAIFALMFGDLMMQLLYRTRPYEEIAGSANELFDQIMGEAQKVIPEISHKEFYKLCQRAIDAFEILPLKDDGSKPRVGVVGEILVKFHPTANNQVVDLIEREGCEAHVPGLVDFFLFGLTSPQNMKEELGTKWLKRLGFNTAIHYIENLREPINKMLAETTRFKAYPSIFELAKKAKNILSLCNTMGEGWLLTAEMAELIEDGIPNIVVASPFACLPNHVVGKSVIKRLRQMMPAANIVAVDYDPGASEVNQLNRIKLMISIAKEHKAQAQDKDFAEKNARFAEAAQESGDPMYIRKARLEQEALAQKAKQNATNLCASHLSSQESSTEALQLSKAQMDMIARAQEAAAKRAENQAIAHR